MNNKKHYQVLQKINGVEAHEYDIIVEMLPDGTKYTLMASNSPEWSESYIGSELINAFDDGNGIILSKGVNKKLTYYEFAQATILFDFINKKENIYSGKILRVREEMNINESQ
jgi:hypothetical protein